MASVKVAKTVIPPPYPAEKLGQHMQLLRAQEDAYWRAQFSKEGYYVRGRGYDQYQPAYAMACIQLLQNPGTEFPEMEGMLEAQWLAYSGSSLLPWREVRGAMQAAWDHASRHTFKMSCAPIVQLAWSDMASTIEPLCRSCSTLADDLQRLSTVPMSDFAGQVLQRHIQMLRGFATELQRGVLPTALHKGLSPLAYWSHCLHSQWMILRSRMAEWQPVEVFELCELREAALIRAYRRTLRKGLPVEMKAVLHHQLQQLQIHAEKLSWVRHNYENL